MKNFFCLSPYAGLYKWDSDKMLIKALIYRTLTSIKH